MQGFNAYIPTRKTSPCENCGDVKGKCRTVRNNEDLILCMNVSCQGDILNSSWKFGGSTNNGGWGKVFTSTRKALTDEEKREYAIKKAEAEAAQSRKNLEIINSIASIPSKDSEYKIKIKRHTLFSKHREAAKRRGLTDRDIEVMGLYSSSVGMHIPIPTLDGHWSGNQVKASNGKYYWGEEKGRNFLKETGQYPLAFWGEKVNPRRIILVEGIGFKVYITSLRFPDCLVIGAAGGMFAQSSIQLQEAVDRFPQVPIILMADADPFNPRKRNVMAAYTATKLFLESIGRSLLVGWWDQLTKSVGDIDEISLSTQVSEILWDDFTAKQNIRSKLLTHASKFYRRMLDKIDVSRVLPAIQEMAAEVDYWYKAERGFTFEYGDDPIPTTDVSELVRGLELAIERGYKYGLDFSSAGLGKSTLAALIREVAGIERILLVSAGYANPTTKEAEESFDVMPSRRKSYWESVDLKTPAGNPIVKTTKPSSGEWIERVGNCAYAAEQIALGQAGYDRPDKNPICKKCPYLKECFTEISTEKGREYGYYYLLKQAMASPRLRIHSAQLAVFAQSDLSRTMAIFDDEKPIYYKELAANRQSIESTWAKIAMSDLDLAARLKPLFAVIDSLLDRKAKYGFDHLDILAEIGDIEQLKLDMDLVARIVCPNLDNLKIGDNHIADRENIRKYGERRDDDRLDLMTLEPNWLMWVLEILTGSTHGVLRLGVDELTVKRTENLHKQISEQAAFTLYLDATQTRQIAALENGVEPDKIFVMSQGRVESPNLTIHNLVGAGTPGKSRYRDCVDAVQAAAIGRHGQCSVLDKKGMGANRGVHFSDSRGSNAYKESKAILSVGTLCLNLGALADEYSLLTGTIVSATSEDPDFKNYIKDRNSAEEIQAVGRLRSTQRPDEELHYYIYADTPNLPISEIMAAYPGAKLVYEEMIDFCPIAAKKGDRLRLKVMEWVSQRDGTFKQKDLAQGVGASESTISAMLKPFGGFRKTLEKLLSISIAFQKFQNSELIDWSLLIEPDLVDYTIKVMDSGDEPLDTAIELEQVLEPLSTGQITALMGCIGKPKAQLLCDLMHGLQTYRDNEYILNMKLAETGDSLQDLADGLRYIVQHGDIVSLDVLRDKHHDDKESMHGAAKLLTKTEREVLTKMVEMSNSCRELRKSAVSA